mmetsp:Transcript_26301/g.51665  ORF Transcript_26301/g.51665 Transcript_26301/m.51665 type:complete len:112 (+) Transcript_26301:785-1120(+)
MNFSPSLPTSVHSFTSSTTQRHATERFDRSLSSFCGRIVAVSPTKTVFFSFGVWIDRPIDQQDSPPFMKKVSQISQRRNRKPVLLLKPFFLSSLWRESIKSSETDARSEER